MIQNKPNGNDVRYTPLQKKTCFETELPPSAILSSSIDFLLILNEVVMNIEPAIFVLKFVDLIVIHCLAISYFLLTCHKVTVSS